MRVRTLSPFSYLVIPEPPKVPRIVHLDADQESGVIKIECYERETGEGCKANTFNLTCGHVEAALRRLLANAKRIDKQNGPEPIERVKRVRKYARRIVAENPQPDLKGVQK